MRKYELTDETIVHFGHTLHRIRALISFNDVQAGDLGGWIETEDNLDQDRSAWVYGDARVYGNARVCGDAQVCGNDTWMTFGPAGSRNDFTTFFACADGGIGVKCGCFHGNLDDFAAKVQATHGDNDHAKVYNAAIEAAKMRICVGEKEAAEACL